MWIFFSLLLILTALLLGPLELELKNTKGRERAARLKLSFYGIPIYRGLFFVHFKHVVRPEIIKVKKTGFRKIYVATFRREEKKYDFGFLFRSASVRKLEATLWLGAGEAAHTALLCGILGTAARSWLKTRELREAKISVRPDFDRARLSLWVHGIVRLTLADIIGRFLKEKRRKFYASYRKRTKYHHVRAK